MSQVKRNGCANSSTRFPLAGRQTQATAFLLARRSFAGVVKSKEEKRHHMAITVADERRRYLTLDVDKFKVGYDILHIESLYFAYDHGCYNAM